MLRLIYVLLSYLLAPFVAVFLLLRGLRNPDYLERFGERFGFSPAGGGPSIWVHAVSVGEVQAASALLRQLGRRYQNLRLVVTTVTPTGASRLKDLFGDSVTHVYAPYDLPGAVRRFFDRANPRLAIIVETELWPNLYHECGRRNVPLVLASARISPRSVRRYRRFVGLFREALSHGIVIAAQSDRDAERFRLLGANPERTHTTGNIKFDLELPENIKTRGAQFRAANATGRPVWVAGSTHPGEESLVIQAHRLLQRRFGDALLMIAPRHPERFSAVETLIREAGLSCVTRSSGERCSPETEVFLIDTLGELTTMYAASDIAFVGGSLVPVGGHNLLEPAALGRPILTGPHTFNAEDIAELLLEEGAAKCVRDVAQLGACLEDWFANPSAAAAVGARGREVVQQNRGAIGRLLDLIDPLIDGVNQANH